MTTATRKKIEDQLSALIGRGFFTRGVHHELLAYRFESERLYIVTDKQWFSVEYQHALRMVEIVTEQPETTEQGINRLENKAALINDYIDQFYNELAQTL